MACSIAALSQESINHSFMMGQANLTSISECHLSIKNENTMTSNDYVWLMLLSTGESSIKGSVRLFQMTRPLVQVEAYVYCHLVCFLAQSYF